jgi:hypothetical protein
MRHEIVVVTKGFRVRYIPPFSSIRKEATAATVRGELRVTLPYDSFTNIVRLILATVDVDEAWYLGQYDDIARAVRSGTIVSGRRHFIEDGYFEGRLPFPIKVDEQWYLAQNPDVAQDVRAGRVVSGQVHFDADGYREGRLPFPL